MENNKVYFMLSILLTLSVIFLIILLSRKKKDKEGYKKCICSSSGTGRERQCQNTEDVEQHYNSNKLTEFTNLKNKNWNEISPGDYKFPVSNDCNWNDIPDNWKEWDFTDF